MKNKTTEALNSELKITKIATGALLGVVSVLFGVCLYGLLTKENNATFIALMVVAFCGFGIILINYSNIKKIKKELESRE